MVTEDSVFVSSKLRSRASSLFDSSAIKKINLIKKQGPFIIKALLLYATPDKKECT